MEGTLPPQRAAPGRRTWLIALIACFAVGALAFGIGRFTAFGSVAEPAPNAADIGFARDMQVHHAQAVEMAMEITRKTADDELRILSYDIATGQAAQRGQMYEWLASWGVSQLGSEPLMSWMSDTAGHAHEGGAAVSDADLRAQMGMATDAELAALRESSGTVADCQFLSLMIRHHQGAIQMVDAVLERGSKQNVLATATAMKQTQSSEIDAMTAMQARLGCR